jgi:hypothetical protein
MFGFRTDHEAQILFYLSYFNGGPAGSLTKEQIDETIKSPGETPLFVRLTNVATGSLVPKTWDSSPTVVWNMTGKREGRAKGNCDVHGFSRLTARLFVRRLLLMWRLDWSYEWTLIVGKGKHTKIDRDPVIPRLTRALCRDFFFRPIEQQGNYGRFRLKIDAVTDPEFPLRGHLRHNLRNHLRNKESSLPGGSEVIKDWIPCDPQNQNADAGQAGGEAGGKAKSAGKTKNKNK